MQKYQYMKNLVLILLLTIGSSSLAKHICQIDIVNPRASLIGNLDLNKRLKPHQRLNVMRLELDSLDLRTQVAKETKVHFYTLDSKKFESIYKPYNVSQFVWRIDFSRSQIFPQFFKKDLNLIEHNAKYYLRMYDVAKEESQISLMFEKRDCIEVMPNKILTGAR
jgi:hypothetical protein